jgi:hypothetical protein
VALLRLPEQVPGGPFEPVSVVSRPWWHEVALWWPQERTLIVAEAIGTAPAFALGRAAGIHPMLRLRPPRTALTRFAPERLLVGHGKAIETRATAAVDDALAHARSDIPRFVLKAPTLLRSG